MYIITCTDLQVTILRKNRRIGRIGSRSSYFTYLRFSHHRTLLSSPMPVDFQPTLCWPLSFSAPFIDL